MFIFIAEYEGPPWFAFLISYLVYKYQLGVKWGTGVKWVTDYFAKFTFRSLLSLQYLIYAGLVYGYCLIYAIFQKEDCYESSHGNTSLLHDAGSTQFTLGCPFYPQQTLFICMVVYTLYETCFELAFGYYCLVKINLNCVFHISESICAISLLQFSIKFHFAFFILFQSLMGIRMQRRVSPRWVALWASLLAVQEHIFSLLLA